MAMKATTKRALWIGGLFAAAGAGVAGIAYAASKPAAPASPFTLPAQFIQGHRYRVVATVPPSTQASVPGIVDLQKMLDSAVGPGIAKVQSLDTTGSSQTGMTVTALVDMLGATIATPPVPPIVSQGYAQLGIVVVVTDLGPIPSGSVMPGGGNIPPAANAQNPNAFPNIPFVQGGGGGGGGSQPQARPPKI